MVTVVLIRKPKSAETKKLLHVMIDRDLDAEDLHKMTKAPLCLVKHLLCGAYTSWPLKAKINSALKQRIFIRPAGAYHRRKPDRTEPT